MEFHETVNYTGHSRIFSSWLMGGANYELSQQFLVEVLFGLRASSVEILGLCSASAT